MFIFMQVKNKKVVQPGKTRLKPSDASPCNKIFFRNIKIFCSSSDEAPAWSNQVRHLAEDQATLHRVMRVQKKCLQRELLTIPPPAFTP